MEQTVASMQVNEKGKSPYTMSAASTQQTGGAQSTT
jgi:hypothetical protein